MRWAAVFVAMAMAVTSLVSPSLGAWPARADESLYQEFYTPPAPLPPGKPGDLIRSEPSRLVLEPSGQLGAYVATGTRIMYRSTDARGIPVAVTGTYFEPDNPWPGKGPRPLIAFATGPYGMGEQCAPSRLFNQGIHFSQGFDLTFGYEETFVATMVARGFAVVVTDGVGLGIPGAVPQFGNRIAAGTALIDAGRAAMQLPNTSLDPAGPVAFWGWSSGGQASASAAELAPTYAPDLRVVGAWSGAPPMDLAALLPFVDGNLLAGATGYILNGIVAAYPEARDGLLSVLTDRGRQMFDWSQNICTLQTVADYAFRHLQFWFTTDPIALANNEPLKGILDLQRLGSMKPSAPVLISTNRWDSFSPWEGSRQLAADWCAKGADVQLWTNEQPPFLNKLSINHLLPYFVDGERAMQWIADRFNGIPTTPNCGDVNA
ncbi:lipase family protein [Mycolicibacterium helvum]|uniref:Secretory lipase family protein n=1 Tax=Mycolicibacterium helvum TaxID=1534349 RepID=A0A7I7T0C8_9MYCO|nr:lipase family protein [Mycolicibacterium helvum]BBY61909.1 secretory lipase family protein [Mycolicibacterium helvum]